MLYPGVYTEGGHYFGWALLRALRYVIRQCEVSLSLLRIVSDHRKLTPCMFCACLDPNSIHSSDYVMNELTKLNFKFPTAIQAQVYKISAGVCSYCDADSFACEHYVEEPMYNSYANICSI